MTQKQGVEMIGLYVRDQDEALAFYVDKLGFKVHTDVRNGPYRWLTVQHPDQPGFQLACSGPAHRSMMKPQRKLCARWWPKVPCLRWCSMWRTAARTIPDCATWVWSSHRSPWTGTATWTQAFGTQRATAGR